MTQVVTTGWPDRLLTLEDWQSLPADELHDVECSEGVLVVTPKPFPRHQWATTKLAAVLNEQLQVGQAALGEVELLLGEVPLTVRAPDVLVTTAAAVRANPARLVAADVSLVVEIMSEGSRRTDRVTKLSEYADAGIERYWVIDLDDPVSLAHHRLDPNGAYELVHTYRGQTEIALSDSTVRVDLDALSSP